MSLAQSRTIDRNEGLSHGLRAVRSGRTHREADLGSLFAMPRDPGGGIDLSDAKAGLYWLSLAQHDSASLAIQQKIHELSNVICQKENSIDAINRCIKTQVIYWEGLAKGVRDVHDSVAKFVATEIRLVDLDAELKLQQEKKRVLAAR